MSRAKVKRRPKAARDRGQAEIKPRHTRSHKHYAMIYNKLEGCCGRYGTVVNDNMIKATTRRMTCFVRMKNNDRYWKLSATTSTTRTSDEDDDDDDDDDDDEDDDDDDVRILSNNRG